MPLLDHVKDVALIALADDAFSGREVGAANAISDVRALVGVHHAEQVDGFENVYVFFAFPKITFAVTSWLHP